jgi:hypothetical protein
MVELKKLMTSSTEIVSSPCADLAATPGLGKHVLFRLAEPLSVDAPESARQLSVYSGTQSVRVAAAAYDHAETSRGNTR